MLAIMTSVQDDVTVAKVQEWADGLSEVADLIGHRFARSEPRERVLEYVRGLLSGAERKNSWTLSEDAGHATPDRMQRLLSTADWDPDLVAGDLRSYVTRRLGEADAVLVLDETGFLKKGTASAGVARQYSGTAGRIENCQIGVFLTYASSRGRTFLDRELYLPKAWTDDPQRCARAGIDPDVQFATKPELGIAMLRRAHADRIPARWVTADEVYGRHHELRRVCEELDYSYVLAVGVDQRVTPLASTDASAAGNAGNGAPETVGDILRGREQRADHVIDALPAQAWRRRSIGLGAKGKREYDWARVRVRGPHHPERAYWLMARRSLSDPTDRAYYLCHAPARTSLQQLCRVAGVRWSIEETFQTSKGQTGLDHYQVRQYTGWYRHITLSMLAHAFLTVTRAEKGALHPENSITTPA